MKKLIAVLLSLVILLSVVITANAVKYVYGRSAEAVVLNFYIDSNKTSVKNFKNLTLKINWNVGSNPRGKSGLESVTSRIEEGKISTVYNNEDSGVTTFSFDSEKGIELGGSTPFLSMAIHSSTSTQKPTVDFYTEGQFIGEDSVDYAKKDIITTELSVPDATITLENPNELNVENIGETESTPATTTPTETIQPTTSATENPEPTEPSPTVSKPKQTNPIKVTAKTKTVKAKKLKRSKVTVNALTVKKAKGEVKYKKLGGSKKLTVNKKGKITIKKRTKKGTYKIKIKITAKGTKKYKSKTVTKKVTIKIK